MTGSGGFWHSPEHGGPWPGPDAALGWQPVALPGANTKGPALLLHDFLEPATAEALFETLRADLAWRQDPIRLFGKWHPQPRLTAWLGDPGTRYRYSGLDLDPAPWPACLQLVRQQVELACGARFNSALANLYRTGADSMGWHSDDEPELGPAPVIASLSLGASRTLRFRRRTVDQGVRRTSTGVALPHGSLLLMAPGCQAIWQHSVPKTSRHTAPRLNLTFRWTGPPGP